MSTCVWTAIWTVLAFLLLLFLGESILAVAGEQPGRAGPIGSTLNASAPSKPS
jgi:hypothetical protein